MVATRRWSLSSDNSYCIVTNCTFYLEPRQKKEAQEQKDDKQYLACQYYAAVVAGIGFVTDSKDPACKL